MYKTFFVCSRQSNVILQDFFLFLFFSCICICIARHLLLLSFHQHKREYKNTELKFIKFSVFIYSTYTGLRQNMAFLAKGKLLNICSNAIQDNTDNTDMYKNTKCYDSLNSLFRYANRSSVTNSTPC